MNGPGKKFAEREQQAADIDVAVVELFRNSRHAVPTATKILTRITAAAAQHIPAVEHRGVIRSVAVTDGQPLVVDSIVQRYKGRASNCPAMIQSAAG